MANTKHDVMTVAVDSMLATLADAGEMASTIEEIAEANAAEARIELVRACLKAMPVADLLGLVRDAADMAVDAGLDAAPNKADLKALSKALTAAARAAGDR